ncbi:MAG: hypothetical protein AAF329_23840 [Cyanobacteria bacterium P01_A01_bin.17]
MSAKLLLIASSVVGASFSLLQGLTPSYAIQLQAIRLDFEVTRLAGGEFSDVLSFSVAGDVNNVNERFKVLEINDYSATFTSDSFTVSHGINDFTRSSSLSFTVREGRDFLYDGDRVYDYNFSFVDLESTRQGDRFSLFTPGSEYFSINSINGIARNCDDIYGVYCSVRTKVHRVPFSI